MFTPRDVAALVIATGFAAGLNVYVTMLVLGGLARLHWAVLPPGLEVLANGWILGVAGVLFVAEFFADKIPAFDLIWNASHTFIRPPVAAFLAFGASTGMSPQARALMTVLGTSLAILAHGSKFAARVAITPSPEPVSNVALSGAEDLLAGILAWAALHHPFEAAAGALIFLLAGLLTAALIAKTLRRRWRRWRAGQQSAQAH